MMTLTLNLEVCLSESQSDCFIWRCATHVTDSALLTVYHMVGSLSTLYKDWRQNHKKWSPSAICKLCADRSQRKCRILIGRNFPAEFSRSSSAVSGRHVDKVSNPCGTKERNLNSKYCVKYGLIDSLEVIGVKMIIHRTQRQCGMSLLS